MMAMEFKEFSTVFINVVKSNNIDKTELGSIMLAITVADSISDSSSRSEFTPAMLLSRSDDNYWDSLVHTLGLDNTKQLKESNHIDIIKKKRLLCDTLMLFGVKNESKILTIPASKTVFPNKQFSTKRTDVNELTGKSESALETDESVIDSIMRGFELEKTDDETIFLSFIEEAKLHKYMIDATFSKNLPIKIKNEVLSVLPNAKFDDSNSNIDYKSYLVDITGYILNDLNTRAYNKPYLYFYLLDVSKRMKDKKVLLTLSPLDYSRYKQYAIQFTTSIDKIFNITCNNVKIDSVCTGAVYLLNILYGKKDKEV